jgi:hypothetical protein
VAVAATDAIVAVDAIGAIIAVKAIHYRCGRCND